LTKEKNVITNLEFFFLQCISDRQALSKKTEIYVNGRERVEWF